eukprot:5776547-Pleurochrysis_carterae.AAC.1
MFILCLRSHTLVLASRPVYCLPKAPAFSEGWRGWVGDGKSDLGEEWLKEEWFRERAVEREGGSRED